ncbi:hypothetical protein EPUL_003872 [Erysiphe pulchra]|uniref:Reverse transcriptase domain-containing protein n=1 Tax=Erysiphe pulchra TaxID=225359 RepID=A0A2S4PV61_9PEZI|nr:hypothetical protein EPUL_003872 [Erysiphe pulchra]
MYHALLDLDEKTGSLSVLWAASSKKSELRAEKKEQPMDRAFSPYNAKTTDLSRDILQITISIVDHRRAPICNIYNAPVGADEAGSDLDLLLKSPNRPFYVGGDFNLRHPLWDMTNTSPQIQIALTGACSRIRPQNGGTPWWNAECQLAVLAYRRARQSGPIVLEKKELRNAVRRAKRAYLRSIIEEAEKLSDVYKIFGTHPKAFKTANVLYVLKNGKRDPTSPSSYKPTALLSCLGKDLERLIARRLSYLALKEKILAKDQCSAVKYRSVTDLTTALNCDIRDAWNKRKVAGMVTVDVKGVFDGILCNRLLFRLRSQGWPICFVKWVESFTDRSANIHFDNITSDPMPIKCSLPQVSPVSPILYLLYILSLLNISPGRFGYADDVTILSSGNTLDDCSTRLQ